VIEHVFNGQRLKIYLPDKKCCLPVDLAYIRCDRYNVFAENPENEPGYPAYDFVKKFCQRDAELELSEVVEESGRRTWVGKVWTDEKDLGLELLKNGLAYLPNFSRGQRQYSFRSKATDAPKAYVKAEAQAKEQQIERWKVVMERQRQREEKSETGKEKVVVISHIDSCVQFSVNLVDSNNFDSMEEKMSRIPAHRARKIFIGKEVAALFDGLYCRAKVGQRDPRQDNQWFVSFVDYGNRASIPERNMAALPSELNLKSWPPLAHRCQLAALRVPPRRSQFFNTAGEYFAHLAMPQPAAPSNSEAPSENTKAAVPFVKECTIKIIFDDWRSRRWFVVLMDQSTNINEQLVKEGHARFDKKGKETPQQLFESENETTKEYLKTVQKLSEEALEARRGMWESGDIDSDEEEAF